MRALTPVNFHYSGNRNAAHLRRGLARTVAGELNAMLGDLPFGRLVRRFPDGSTIDVVYHYGQYVARIFVPEEITEGDALGNIVFIVGNSGAGDYLRNTPLGDGRQYLYQGPGRRFIENTRYHTEYLEDGVLQHPWETATAGQVVRNGNATLMVTFGGIYGGSWFVTERPSILSSSSLVAITGVALWGGRIYAANREGRAFVRPFAYYDPADNEMYDVDTNPTGWREITIDLEPLGVLNSNFPFFRISPHRTERKFLTFGREDVTWELNSNVDRPEAYHIFELTIEQEPDGEYVGEWVITETLDAKLPGSNSSVGTLTSENGWDDPPNVDGMVDATVTRTTASARSGQVVAGVLYDLAGEVMVIRQEFSWTRSGYFQRYMFHNHVQEPAPWLQQPGPIYTDGGASSTLSSTFSGTVTVHFGDKLSMEIYSGSETVSETATTVATHIPALHIPSDQVRPGSYDRNRSSNETNGLYTFVENERSISAAHSDPRFGLMKLDVRDRTVTRTDTIAMTRADHGADIVNTGIVDLENINRLGSIVLSDWITLLDDVTLLENVSGPAIPIAAKGPTVEFSESSNPHTHALSPTLPATFSEPGFYSSTGLPPTSITGGSTIGWTEAANDGRGNMVFSAAGYYAGLPVREDVAVWNNKLVDVIGSLPAKAELYEYNPEPPVYEPPVPYLLAIGTFNWPLVPGDKNRPVSL